MDPVLLLINFCFYSEEQLQTWYQSVSLIIDFAYNGDMKADRNGARLSTWLELPVSHYSPWGFCPWGKLDIVRELIKTTMVIIKTEHWTLYHPAVYQWLKQWLPPSLWVLSVQNGPAVPCSLENIKETSALTLLSLYICCHFVFAQKVIHSVHIR